jgi:hypothetical protein
MTFPEVLIFTANAQWHIVTVGASARTAGGPREVAWCDREGAVVCFVGEELAFAPLPDYETTVRLNATARGDLP